MSSEGSEMRKLIKIARTMMSCYALRWRVIREDPAKREHAKWLIAQAVRLRGLSHRLTQINADAERTTN